MKKAGRWVVVIFVCFVLSGVSVYGQDAALSFDDLEALMKNKTIENCEKAVKGYEALLKNEPENYKILYKLANAYTGIIDIKTSALRVEKDEYKPMLRKLGTLANDYAKKAYAINPKDKDVVAACLVSYGYVSASYGIVKAILKGAAGHYKKLCNELIAIDDKHLGALGYRMLGKLYHVAPWPVGSKKKAVQFFKKAIETDNTGLYSHYYLGLVYFQDKKYDLAEPRFQFVCDNEASGHEKHYFDVYKKMARFYVRQVKRITKKK
ncbi:MAG: hypothetical protein GY950_16745 [bacterium]|nr:hypothetical protein [bacterium]